MDSLRFILQSKDLVAVLGREIPVRLVNFSGSGCLVATSSSLHEGATASMRLDVGGVEYTDDVRVVRCTRIEGSSDTTSVWNFSGQLPLASGPCGE